MAATRHALFIRRLILNSFSSSTSSSSQSSLASLRRMTLAASPSSPPLRLRSFLASSSAASSSAASSSAASSSAASSSSSLPRHIVSFPLAQTGEGIAECEIVQWYTKEGERVQRFGRLCEVQSDKAAVEITSPYDGRLSRIVHAAGAIAKVGEPICEIEVEGELPVGAVAVDITETENDPQDGFQKTDNGRGDGRVGDAASEMDEGDGAGKGKRSVCSPAVRRLAREKGIELEDVAGSGPKGRVLKADLLEHLEKREGVATAGPAQVESGHGQLFHHGFSASAATSAGAAAAAEGDEDVVMPLRGYDRAMARAMTTAAAVPHLLYCDDVQMDALHAAREALRTSPSSVLQGAKLTYLPLLLKALSLALLDFPRVNASFGADSASIVLKKRHNIGVAMATPNGLVVPNIKAVDRLSVADVAIELRRLQALAAANKLDRTGLEGGTITVSNIGSFGGTYAAPLLNVPEAAIVAIGKVRRVPGFDADGNVVPQSIMGVSWSADHRVVDGETVARLCGAWKEMIENPTQIILRTR